MTVMVLRCVIAQNNVFYPAVELLNSKAFEKLFCQQSILSIRNIWKKIKEPLHFIFLFLFLSHANAQ